MRALWTLWLALMAVVSSETPDVGLEVAALGLPPATTAELDSRVEDLTTRLRCPVCQGLNVAESRSEAALAMKARIQELVEQGYTQDQVVAYFTDRYGDWVLLEPPRTGMNWVLWSAPFGLLLIGGVWISARYRERRSLVEEKVGEGGRGEGEEANPYVAQLLSELEEKP